MALSSSRLLAELDLAVLGKIKSELVCEQRMSVVFFIQGHEVRLSEIALLLLSIISFQAFKNDMMMLTFLEGSDH